MKEGLERQEGIAWTNTITGLGLVEARLTDVVTACAFAFLCDALLHDSAIEQCTMSADTYQ